MDIATHFHPRQRAGPYRDMEGNAMREDSGGESESNLVRRKFQRTTTDPEPSNTFPKPSLPASATRQTTTSSGVSAAVGERRPSFTGHQRRRSTLRENMRVPSGPREFPSSPGKQRVGSTSSVTPSVTDNTNSAGGTSFALRSADRAFQKSNAESYFYNSRMGNSSHTRLESFGSGRVGYNNASKENIMDSPSTPSRDRTGYSFEFLPDVNFDDFQTSIRNYDGNSPLLSEFPSVDGGKILPKEENYGIGKPTKEQQLKNDGLGRTQSLRQRLAGGRQTSVAPQTIVKDSPALVSAKESWKNRRQSSINQASSNPPPPSAAAAKPPRKSVGPGLITNMMKSNPTPQQQTSDATIKPSLSRNTSLSKYRRTTIQPSTPTVAEPQPRVSTLTATTQSRQNKVKSLQPPPRDGGTEPNTPSKLLKGAQQNQNNRAHTPSSSGNRRQSMASGRASGLGARTVSPTDARRLKRMSMMHPPPLPTGISKGAQTPTPGEEVPNPMNTSNAVPLPELPRLAQPSPSFIPRKTSNATPTSARASPEGRQGFSGGGGVPLSAKSSYSSLINSGTNGSTSRLPTPKPRNGGMQSSSSMAQYGEDSEQEELVPPVPAIPKAYESPKELEQPPFFSSSLKSSQSGFSDLSLGESQLPAPRFLSTPRTSLDVPAETPRKRSGELARPVTIGQGHKRTNTLTNGTNGSTSAVPPPSAPPGPVPRSLRAQPDPNGRRNNNLQPLRLPPMNLMPINTRFTQNIGGPQTQPRPSQEVDTRDAFANFTTPEPKRGNKTPSTPMTASKATFFSRRQEDKALRSSSSHYALRDLMGMDEDGNLTTKFYWDEGSGSDMETYSQQGVPIGSNKQGRGNITPFASGSLPKHSGEFVRAAFRGRPSGEYPVSAGTEDEYNLGGYDNLQLHSSKPFGSRTRAQTNTTINSVKSGLSMEMTAGSHSEGPSAGEKGKKGSDASEKKDSGGSGGGLRRKLSLGWRRSSSKAANHGDNKGSPQQETGDKDGKERARLQKRNAGQQNEMPPPKLPASATWTGDVPSLLSSTRPSFDASALAHARRKSPIPNSTSSVNLADGSEQQPSVANGIGAGVKTRSLHSEQPTPVTQSSASSGTRAGSWGNLRAGGANKGPPNQPRGHKFTPSTLSALVKDKDDLTADEEMHRLSRKRKDVDTAAREADELKRRAIAKSPVSAEHILHERSLSGGSTLNVFERGEIVDYEQEGIYFTGTRSARKVIGSLNPSPQPSLGSDGKGSGTAGGGSNFGYDDERGDYNIVLGDHLAYRYEVVDILGKGSFGQVVRCVDHKEGGVVAVKIIRNKKRFHQQALVEVGILGRLREWDPDEANATLSITSSFYFRSHLCIVTPCLSINLYELIRAHNFQGFSLPLIRRFARQLLATLVLLQSKRIIHCDLKPENILLCEARKADVRVIDFGSSCREEEKVYTYIQSRFYRSPEVILGSSYGLGIDMWSLGCILAELWTGYPLFPGENEQEQLACIMEIFGPPDRHLVERCTRKKLFFDSVGKPRVTVSSKGRRRRPSSKTLQQSLKSEDEAFIDFIARCLRWDPDRRLKPSEAVGHPFIMNMPFHQRPGIPDEARRAARVRSNAAVPATSAANPQAIPSPVKRSAASTGNAFALQAATTPARDRARPLPETPQTAVRNGLPATSAAGIAHNQGSPVRVSAGANRRHSTLVTAGGAAAAMAGSKRASNGAVLAGGLGPGVGGPAAQQQQLRGGSGSLAQLAATASMGVTGGSGPAGSSRWRS